MREATVLTEQSKKQQLEVLNVCCHFGCGKHLSLVESLAGKFCTHHQREKPVDIMKVIKFK